MPGQTGSGNDGPPVGDVRVVGPITRRLVCAMALIPIVPAVAGIAVRHFIDCFPGGSLDELRWFNLFVSTLWVAGTICIWRAVILWTLGRRWLTALVSLIPFVQVVWARSVWTTGGCLSSVSDGMLRIGQQNIGLGLWIWITIWVWWGWEKGRMAMKPSAERAFVARMTPTAKRLAAAIGSIPLLSGVFVIIVVALDDLRGLSEPITEAFACSAVVAVVVWIVIWRRVVPWSFPVIRSTAVCAFIFLALPIVAQGLFLDGVGSPLNVVLVLLPVIGWGLWMAVTVSVWPRRPPTGHTPDLQPRCLRCGYLLIGLRATRCPECGDEPTLDELWQATAGEGLEIA